MKIFLTLANICLAAEVFVLKLLNLLKFIPNRYQSVICYLL